jgi:hypothetical protein
MFLGALRGDLAAAAALARAQRNTLGTPMLNLPLLNL